jgi:hypothetical protein
VVLVWVVGNLFLLVPMVRFAMQLSESQNGPPLA